MGREAGLMVMCMLGGLKGALWGSGVGWEVCREKGREGRFNGNAEEGEEALAEAVESNSTSVRPGHGRHAVRSYHTVLQLSKVLQASIFCFIRLSQAATGAGSYGEGDCLGRVIHWGSCHPGRIGRWKSEPVCKSCARPAFRA